MINLIIYRESFFFGSALPYRIYINGEEVKKISSGSRVSLTIPETEVTLKVSTFSNFLCLHKSEKEITLYPEQCKSGTITCDIRPNLNTIGYLTSGLFQPIVNLTIDVVYE